MAKLLVMTDLHLTAGCDPIIGLDPCARFAQGLCRAGAEHSDADRLILMGDLTHRGDRQAYEHLRHLLKDVPWPVTFMLGNHDRRDVFRATFPEAAIDQNGFVQAVIDLPDTRVITLDSQDDAASEGGRLCPRRMRWLESALSGAGGRSCLVFVHHPPFETGFAGMDGIGLQNATELRTLLGQHRVKHVFAGHIHRTITASVDGMTMTVFKSTCHQMPMLLGKPGFGHSVDEPGGYGIVLTDGGNTVVHFEDFTLPEQDVAYYDN